MKSRLIILSVLLISFVLRVASCSFNLPYIEFTDELSVAQDALHLAQTGEYKNFHFLYPPLHAYLQSGVLFVYCKLAGMNLDNISRSELFPLLRTFVAVLGTFSVLLVYLITKKITKNNLMAVLSMLLLAFNLTHVGYSELVKNDLPITFFGLIAFIFALNILETGSLKWYFLSGMFVGFSTATGYLGATYFIPIITSHFLHKFKAKRRKNTLFFPFELFIAVLGFGLGFSTGDPILILDTKLFLDKIYLSRRLLEPYMSPHSFPAWKWYLLYYWHYGLYYPVFLSFVGGMVIAFRKYTRYFLVILSFLLGFGVVIVPRNNYYTDRLSLPLVPFFVILAGIFLGLIFEKSWKFFNKRIYLRVLLISVYILLFLGLFIRIAVVSYQKTLSTPLQQVEKFLEKNAREKDSVLITAGSLPFSPNKMEEKYRFFYYYPEIINRSVEFLPLSYDYVVLYWQGNLPQKWIGELMDEYQEIGEFTFPGEVKKLAFLNPYAEISNPYLNARSYFGQRAVVYKLPPVPKKNYIVLTKLERGDKNYKGEFDFIKGSEGKETIVVYSLDFVLTSETGSQQYTDYFKPVKAKESYTFTFNFENKQFDFDKFLTSQIKRVFEDSIRNRLNLGMNVELKVVGQSKGDYCALGGPCHPSGDGDFYLRLSGIEKEIRRIVVSMGEHTWMTPFNGAYADIYTVQDKDAIDLYFQLFTNDDIGKKGQVIIYFKDESYSLVTF